MKCTSCGAALPTGVQSCPFCGFATSISRNESSLSIIRLILFVIAGALVLTGALLTVALGAIRAQIVTRDGQQCTGQYKCTGDEDRKSTRLNSSHQIISYAVFCLKKKK